MWPSQFCPKHINAAPSWQTKAAQKAAHTASLIPSDWLLSEATLVEGRALRNITGEFIESLLSSEEREITAWPAPQIVENIRDCRCTAKQVTKAFCKRAAIAHQLNNCLHEVFFEQAFQTADRLDEYQQTHRDICGPLHGVPVSLKDQFHVKDVETTMGYVGWIGTFEGVKDSSQARSVESETVLALKQLGAVLYCKTSLPQTLLIGETHNNIFGYTMNPVNQILSCGGSSGGECALLALGGSCLGVGTDIGGSVSIPAAFCGIYSVKPSFSRFSYKNMANSNPGQTIVKSAVGFMSTSLPSLKLIQTALLSTKPWERDPDVAPIDWRPRMEEVERELCFGIMTFDGEVMPHPPVVRGVQMVKDALVKAGYKVIDWKPPRHREGSHIHNEFMDCDGGANIWQQLNLSGEPPIEELADVYGTGPKPAISLFDYQLLCLHRIAYREKYSSYWNSTTKDTGTGRPVDALIMPVAPHAAVLTGKYYHYDYSDVINLLDYTSITIPVTKADKAIDVFDAKYKPCGELDKMNWKAYDASIYDGAPVSVQVVARQFQEERCYGLVQEVLKVLRHRVE